MASPAIKLLMAAGGSVAVPMFKAAGTANSVSATDQITLSLPGGWGAGDFAVACVSLQDNVAVANYSATGWTLSVGTSGAQSVRANILTRVLQGGDSDPTFVWSSGGGSNNHAGFILTYSGVTTTHGGWQFTNNGSSDTESTPTSQSTSVNGSIMLSFGYSDFYQPGSLKTGSEQGFTVRQTKHVASQGSLLVCDKTISSAGSVTFPTYTGSAFYGKFFFHKAIELSAT